MDPYAFEKLDPDLHSPKMLDPNPHKVNAGPNWTWQWCKIVQL
jgi:hypothetical protein